MKKRIVILTDEPVGFGEFQEELINFGFQVLAGPASIAQSMFGDVPFIENFDLIIIDQKSVNSISQEVDEIIQTAKRPVIFLTLQENGRIMLAKQASFIDVFREIQAVLASEREETHQIPLLEPESNTYYQLEELAINTGVQTDFHYELKTARLIIDGFSIQLSPKEERLINALATCKTGLISNSELYESVWEKEYQTRNQPFLSNLILRVRKKVAKEHGTKESFIINKKGKGYQINEKFVRRSK